jgi:ABC-type antimicrobial peptide transport system permease subunit
MYLKYPSRSLIRGGQRTLLAIFCVTVGVMAIVTMQLVGLMINNAFTSNVRDANGGDIAVSSTGQFFEQSDLSFFEQLKREGTIQNYTASVNMRGFMGRGSPRQAFTVRIVDPAVYPLATPPTFSDPQEGTLVDLLKQNQVIATQSFIDQYHNKPGDTLTIVIRPDTEAIRTLSVKIVGVVSPSGVLAQAGSLLLLSVNDYKASIPSQGSSSSQSGQAPQQAQTSPGGAGTHPVSLTDQNPVFYDTINITADAQNVDRAAKQIRQHFPVATTQTANDVLQQKQTTVDQVQNFLSIAGLLTLLIGGVGIVNTMQVLLSRRKTEIAMLKTVGYRQKDLSLLFGLEAGLLGLIGGIVGAGVAIGVSYLVRNIVQQAFGLNIPFVLDWFTIGSGVVIGLATSLIFGLLPIAQAANVRPLNVIRELPERRGGSRLFLTIFLLLVLSVLFCLLAIVILNNNVFLGIASVYGVSIFLGVLSIFFGLVTLLISKLPVPERFSPGYLVLVVVIVALSAALLLVLPAFGGLLLVFALLGFVIILLPQTWKANIKIALRNIGRSRARTTTTMLALFVGIFTIGLILALGQGLRDQFNGFIAKSFHYNVYAVTTNNDTTILRNKLKTLPGLTGSEEHTIVATSPLLINGTPIGNLLGNQSQTGAGTLGRSGALHFLSGIEGYDVGNNQLPATDTLQITDGRNLQPEDAGTDNVVISSLLATLDPLHLKVGDTIVLTNTTGSINRIVTVVGIYQTNSSGLNGLLEPIRGTKNTVKALSPVGLESSVFYLQIDENQLNKATDTIGQEVPNATVSDPSNFTDFVNEFLNDAILVLTTVASLSLLAGVIIIANAVALAMLERRRELGILKSIGHSSRSLLSEVLLENGIVGATGALIAMVLVTLATSLLGQFVLNISLEVSPIISLALILGSAGLAMLVSVLVAWGAVRVRPLEVLRYE